MKVLTGKLFFQGRMGSRFTVPAEFCRVSRYSPGPFETYPDRKCGGKIGLYEDDITKPLEYYIKPQDCGNICDCRYLCLKNSEGTGILVSGEENYSMQALPFTSRQIMAARHIDELPVSAENTVCVDYCTTGLGNRSCGPEVLSEYRTVPKCCRYVFSITPVMPDTDIDSVFLKRRDKGIIPKIIGESRVLKNEYHEAYRDPSDEDVRKRLGFA